MSSRKIYLLWEINRIEGGQCLRSVDESKQRSDEHLTAVMNEARMLERDSRFYVEETISDHLYGHNDMKAAVFILRGPGLTKTKNRV